MAHARDHEREHARKVQLRLAMEANAAAGGGSSPAPIFLDPSAPVITSTFPATTTKPIPASSISRVFSTFSVKAGENQVRIRLRDVNPLKAIGAVMTSYNNIAATAVSGILFSCQYAISYTAVATYSSPPYNFGSTAIGLVLLAFGLGNIVGSVAGGKYSDVVLRRLKEANGGVSEPEMRIRSTRIAMIFLPVILII